VNTNPQWVVMPRKKGKSTRNTTQQVASKMFCSVVCFDGGKGPNKNN